MLGFNLGKTLLNGAKRAFRVNVTEQTDEDDVQDALAKAIKISVRALVLIVLAWLFPDQFQAVFEIISP